MLSNNWRDTYTNTHTDGKDGWMKYAYEIGSHAVINVPRFINLLQTFRSWKGGGFTNRFDLLSIFRLCKWV